MNARSKKPRPMKPSIPQEAIDACEASWDAANQKKRKVDPKRHDASSVFVMTCRHSQVLFLCNIDTPGEQQQYIVACLEEVKDLIPLHATIVQAYDVGCVTDHSLNLWVCQIVYSPRLCRGLCLTDAEGVERFWSRIRKLIGITRNQWNSRRIWMINQYTAFVNEEGRDNLGSWIHRQEHKNLVKKCTVANKVLRDCGVPVAELRRNWEEQKAAQTSIRSYAPMRLKRELDKVLALQTQIDTVEQSIANVKQSITGPATSAALLRSLEKTHETLGSQAQQLYASLNIQDSFPEFQGLPLEFVQTLLLMQDLKINIWKRAVGMGGRREALGTKLHQATRKAISKRQPALLRSIAKFNAYCVDLERVRPPGCPIPIPPPLSTQLNSLRDDPSLHEDVWITPAQGEIPRWLDDADVRDGIRALHSADRCAEEASRLNMEHCNMANWLTQELSVVTLAIDTLTDSSLSLALQIRLEQLQFLRLTWANSTKKMPEPPAGPPPASSSTSAASAAPAASAASTAPSTRVRPSVTMTVEPDSLEDMVDDDSSDHWASEMLVVSKELDPDTLSDTDHDNVLNVQEMLNDDLDEAESTIVDGENMRFEIDWTYRARNNLVPAHDYEGKRVVVGLDGRPNMEMEIDYIARVQSRASDEELWRHLHHTWFWEKSLWLIPIHRAWEEHWVLAVVDVGHQQILFFDSLGVQGRSWRWDIQDIMVLTTWLVVLANRHKFPLHVTTEEAPWVAHPIYTVGEARQSNGHDCGVWVLCMIAAIIRGFATTGVTEYFATSYTASAAVRLQEFHVVKVVDSLLWSGTMFGVAAH
ncbi:hypothetical protein B0H17DRAFT_1131077 [Mycena rosella]|uniref:Ubiquitin-like protease family profile domain-containing protein n=1 Tax=Mycena rosella TaxID=1033263 RepID=A0AAD7DR81_MYCRO|nr:hypothetical protein B0H17DRAFT_1131077 [Mycena rosella]